MYPHQLRNPVWITLWRFRNFIFLMQHTGVNHWCKMRLLLQRFQYCGNPRSRHRTSHGFTSLNSLRIQVCFTNVVKSYHPSCMFLSRSLKPELSPFVFIRLKQRILVTSRVITLKQYFCKNCFY